MFRLSTKSYIITLLIVMISGCATEENGMKNYSQAQLEDRLADFTETEIRYETDLLDDRQEQVVAHLYDAAKFMDDLFLDQVYSRNDEIRQQLKSGNTRWDAMALDLFEIMFGPFDRLNHNKPFYGNEPKPEGANYYPEDMTRDDFQQWIEAHPEDEEAFTSEYTMIRRQSDSLVAIPYSEYYLEELTRAAEHLRKAAAVADNPSLRRYLELRAEAFLSNDYYESNMAWMDLEDHRIEVVIGPYEVYEDQLFNYKAAFECFITIRDPEESRKLERFAGYLTDLEKNLPLPEKHKNYDRGLESPIVVAQEVFSAGDTKAGVQTLAFNLPNDERVRKAKGSKKVMLKNVNEAKFRKLLQPIAREILPEDQLEFVTFDGFFNHVLMHEMSHGIGPGVITVDGEETQVQDELKEAYSTIEECKADVLGMYNNIYMIEQGEYAGSFERETWITFLAGTFRSVRFGINEAHGAGNAIIYNYLLEKGAYEYDAEAANVEVNFVKIYDVVEQLANEILTIQANGDYQGAKSLIENYAVMSPSMETLIEKLDAIPVDIKPVFQVDKLDP